MTSVVSLVQPVPDNSKERMIAALREHITAVENGVVTGLILLGVGPDKVTRQVVNLMPPECVPLLSWALYKVHQDWDTL